MSEGATVALDGQHQTPEHVHLDRKKIGRQLIIAAWAIEILAALIGILIAVLVILSTQQNIGEADIEQRGNAAGIMNAFLGGLPFLVVAAVELTKIPLATACYHATSRIWKGILIAGMFFLMVITFETILNGFERNFTQRTYVIKQTKKEVVSTEEEINKINNDISSLSRITTDTIRTEYEEESDQIEQGRKREIQEIAEERKDILKSFSGQDEKLIQRQINQIDMAIGILDDDYAEDRLRIETDSSDLRSKVESGIITKREIFKSQIDRVIADINRSYQLEKEELSTITDTAQNATELENEVKRIEANYDDQIKSARSEVSSKRVEIGREIDAETERRNELFLRRDNKIERRNNSEALTTRKTIEKDTLVQNSFFLRSPSV